MKNARKPVADRVAYAFDRVMDRIILAILIAITLIGVYSIYDALYLYGNETGRLYYFLPSDAKTRDDRIPADAVGWLSVEDTGVDFPVMQGKDNNEYLNRNPEGEFSFSGSVFLDYRNDPAWQDDYNLLYGHHMSGGRMFGALDRFMDRSYFDGHRNGMLRTKKADYRLRLFAVAQEGHADGALFDCGKEEERAGVESCIRKHAQIWYRPETHRILAMTTCMDSGSTRRLIVFASMKAIRVPGSLGF